MRGVLAIAFAGWTLAGFLVAPARAQIPVTDLGNLQQEVLKLGQIIQQVSTAKSQLDQAMQLVDQARSIYNAANQLTNVNSIGAALSNPLLRQFLPPDVTQLGNIVTSGLDGNYASLTGAAQAFADANRILSPTAGHSGNAATDFYDQVLSSRGNSIASFMAQGQAVFQAANARLAGLEQLRQALDTSHDAKQTADLQARLASETALVNNDIMRLQGLQMVQQQQLASYQQQGKEANAARISQLLAIYQGGSSGTPSGN